MKFAFFALVILVGHSAFALQFFENSIRRNATSLNDIQPIVKIRTISNNEERSGANCSGFFVKNRDNKPFVATARHCASYQLAKACSEDRIFVKTEYQGYMGHCKQVIASTTSLDMAVMEVEFEKDWEEVKGHIQFLTMSEDVPKVGTKVTMTGYPMDKFRKGQVTVTQQCQISGGRVVAPLDYTEAERDAISQWQGQNIPDPEVIALIQKLRPRTSFHNCSVYAGNSGGPIVIANTKIVLGMPASYYPEMYRPLPQTLSAKMDTTAEFISAQRTQLEAAGVEFYKAK